jgi:microcystin-dependent protein
LWQVVFDHLTKLTADWSWQQVSGGAAIDQITSEIQAAIDAAVFKGCSMIGQVMWLTVDVPPWAILCDGTQYGRVDYPDLYAALQSAYVVDADNFVVPDLIDRVAIGSIVAGAEGGEATHVLTANEMPIHQHGFTAYIVPQVGAVGADPGTEPGIVPGLTDLQGGGASHNNIQPYHALTPVIIARWPDA